MKTVLCENNNLKENSKEAIRRMANILNSKDFQYLIFGKIVCRYPALNDSKGYSLTGDIASSNGWQSSVLSMKLKMDEINDVELYSLDELKKYCIDNKIDINLF